MGSDTVYKIVPVGGLVEINDAEQTTFENAFQEIVVSRKLSDLAGDEVNRTDKSRQYRLDRKLSDLALMRLGNRTITSI